MKTGSILFFKAKKPPVPKQRKTALQLAADIAAITAIALLNQCSKNKEKPLVKRDGDEKSLNKRLAIVNLVYHAIGIFYNE